MQCLILAGGLGTRLGDATRTLPKHLIPVLGKPFAEHQLAWLRRCGVERVVYSIGYRGQQIRELVGDGSRFGMSASWVEDGPAPLGTGGPVRKAFDAGLLDESFCVLYGDSYLPLDLAALAHAFKGSAMMSVLRNGGRWGASNARVENGRVALYRKGGEGLEWIDYGATMLRREVAGELPEGANALETLYERLSREGRLDAYEVSERFYEVGSPEGIAELEGYLAENEAKLAAIAHDFQDAQP